MKTTDKGRGDEGGRFEIRARGGERQRSSDEPMDALEMLEEQHREVERLFATLANGPDGAEFRRNFLQIADKLAIHSTIEEHHFYPAVKRADTKRELEHFVQEHLEVKRMLAVLLETSQSDPNLMGEIEELQGLVDEHVQEEEGQLFPKVRKLIDREQLVAIAQEMASTMAELEQEGEPRQHVPEETDKPAPL